MDENSPVVPADTDATITLATDIIAAYVSNNHIAPTDLPALIASTHAALTGLSQQVSAAPQVEKLTPAQIKKSITPDALISFIDGKPYKTLKRHLGGHGLTIEAYRERFGLPKDYPAVAASYSEARSALARNLGLGRPRKEATPKVAAVAETIADAPKPASRRKAAGAAAKPARARKPKKAEPAEAAG